MFDRPIDVLNIRVQGQIKKMIDQLLEIGQKETRFWPRLSGQYHFQSASIFTP